MPQPTAGDVHIDAALTQLSIGYMQDPDDFIATQVFPFVNVQKQSDKYFTYDKGDFFRDNVRKRAPGDESAGGGFRLSNDNYFCDIWALHKDIADPIRANCDPAVNLEDAAAKWLAQQFLISMERQFVTEKMVTNVWDYEVSGASSSGTDEAQFWDTYSTSTPIQDIKDARTYVKSTTGKRPNTFVCSEDVWTVLEEHPAFLDRIKYTSGNSSPAMVTKESVAAILGVDRVIVASSVYNAAKEGAADSIDFVMEKKAWLGYVPKAPTLFEASAGYTFVWTGYSPLGTPGVTRNFRVETRRSDRIETEVAYDFKTVATALGAFFNDIIAG